MPPPLLAPALLALALLAPAPAAARPPKDKDVDARLSSLNDADRAPLVAAQTRQRELQEESLRVVAAVELARLDQLASKAWLDASSKVLEAIDGSEAAAKAGDRIDELSDLAGRRVRAQRTVEWRTAEFEASKLKSTLEAARLVSVKAELSKADAELVMVRLQVYNAAIGSSAEVEVEIGKAQTKVGRLGTQAARERSKLEAADKSWLNAQAHADALKPAE